MTAKPSLVTSRDLVVPLAAQGMGHASWIGANQKRDDLAQIAVCHDSCGGGQAGAQFLTPSS
jgi:hypothetical protein